MTAISPLLTTASLGSLTLKNRVALAPLTRGRAPGGLANSLMAEYYQQRSGAGLLITEGTFISEAANGWVDAPGIYTQEMAHAWQSVVSAVHKASPDTKFFSQLWHCGRASHSSFRQDRSPAVAPSPIKIEGPYIHTPEGKQPYEVPREMTIEDIQKTVADYRSAAEWAKVAGFDGVEIHSANGYLLDSFLQSKTNHRQDAYGGNLENRFRMLKEVVEAVSSVYPASQVGVRLSPNGVYNDMGSPDYLEAFSYYLRELDPYQLAYVHVLDGLAFGFHNIGDPFTLTRARENYRGKIIGNCGYDVEAAERAISEGLADIVAFGRPFISNPDLVERIKNKWPLDPQGHDTTYWFTPGEKGYTTFPTYTVPVL